MTRISNADQVLLLLRERLQRLDKRRPGRAAASGAAQGATAPPMARLQALAALDGLSGDEFQRTLVRAVMTEEMGEGIANDPSFQAIVDEVLRVIGASADGRSLLERAGRQMRSGL
jgi:hypothetical protein